MPAVDLFEWLRMPATASRSRSYRLNKAMAQKIVLLNQPDIEKWLVFRDWIGTHNIRMDLVSDTPHDFAKPIPELEEWKKDRIRKVFNLDAWVEANRLNRIYNRQRNTDGALPAHLVLEWNDLQRLKQIMMEENPPYPEIAAPGLLTEDLFARVLRVVHYKHCACQGSRVGHHDAPLIPGYRMDRYFRHEKWLVIRALWLRLYNEKITHYEGRDVFKATNV